MNSPRSTQPIRFQRKRTKGWNMQQESQRLNGRRAIYVGRPTIWGNPFVGRRAEDVVNLYAAWLNGFDNFYAIWRSLGGGCAVREMAYDPRDYPWRYTKDGVLHTWSSSRHRAWLLAHILSLRGKNLCCWCPLLDKNGNKVYCHADVLLKLANREAPDAS